MSEDKKKRPEEEAAPAEKEEKRGGLAKRQSGPQPTEEEYAMQETQRAAGAEMERAMQDPAGYLADLDAAESESAAAPGATNGFMALQQVIGPQQVKEAQQILLKYKQGKANLERRIVENEEWYKLNQWDMMPGDRQDVMPTSAWLFNCIANKHADAVDNYPAPNILPREEADKGEAEILTAVVPVVLEQNDFEQTYSDVMTYKLKSGTGVYGVYWDKTKQNGLGDISIVKVDLLNLFWEPGITNIQSSRHLFHVELVDNEALLEEYPQLADKLGPPTMDVAKYIYDDSVDTSEKSVVVDWYYHRIVDGRSVLHMCKFVNNEVLFASENDPELRERGWYDHGMFPFIFDPLYEVEGSPAGFGYVDIGKGTQTFIARLDQAILKNALANAAPRYFFTKSGSVNPEEFCDLQNEIVEVTGMVNDDSVRPIEGKPLPAIYYEVLNGKINELKETSGNRDVNTGGTTPGATAASAIAAMQEAGGKLSRDNSKASYRAYRRLVLMVIELIRQFYTLPRQFRILGQDGTVRYITYSNINLQARQPGMDFGVAQMEQMLRAPLFDVQVSAQKASPYSKMSQNELALQLYQAGLFAPANYDQALLCLEMMDFDRKEDIMQKIAQNGMIFQQAMMAQAAMMGAAGAAGGGQPAQLPPEPNELGAQNPKESPYTRKARQRSAESITPT